MKNNPETILGSQSRLMKSKIAQRTYRISISLPWVSFAPSNKASPFEKPLEKWPVVYVTDANWWFGTVSDMTRAMSWCGGATDTIIVGIGYPEAASPFESRRKFLIERSYDLSPSNDADYHKRQSERFECDVPMGGASKFLQFIKQELIPAIESEFPTDPAKRVLLGHSLGGLFCAYSLFEAPGLFDTYLVCSPSLWWDDKFLLRHEEQYANRHKRLPAKVYLSIGEFEDDVSHAMVPNAIRFGTVLESRKYKGLTLKRQIFHGLNHCEVTAPCFQAGLKFALQKD